MDKNNYRENYSSNFNNNYSQIFKKKLYNKYSINLQSKYNICIIKNILLNRKSHIVSTFKDSLLFDDFSEFLKRFYKSRESEKRIAKIANYFKETSVLYPNYSPLIEAKYLYSNIIKKQIVINKQEDHKKKMKNINIKNHYLKNDKENKIEEQFFSNTIYDEILNESESFMNKLFDIDKATDMKENKARNNNIDNEGLIMIINKIEEYEDKLDHNEDNVLAKDNELKTQRITVNIKNSSNYNNNNEFNVNKNLLNSMNKNSLLSNKYTKSFRHILKIEKTNKKYLENNKNNEIFKENNHKITEDKKQDESNSKSNLYHRKINSSLTGNFINKLELPSNFNVVNMLKNANETYAGDIDKKSMRAILYKAMKSNNILEKKNSKHKFLSLKQQQPNKSLTTNNLIKSNHINSINKKEEIKTSSKQDKNCDSRNSKIIKMKNKAKIHKNNYFGIKKRISPLSSRIGAELITYNEDSNKGIILNNNTSNGTMFTKISQSITSSIFSSYKKSDNVFKSVVVNPSFTGPYSKPKCKDIKYTGIPTRKLFSELTEKIDEEIKA